MAFISTETKPTAIDTTKSYVVPLVLVTSLFFLWGLANILNSALIAHFQPVFEIKRTQALLVESAFYFGYFTLAIPAGLFMERYTYKKGILLGLLLYASGALLFIPAAKTITFGYFLIALYIIASGLAFLETAANPYVTILGKPESSVQRLNFSQFFNGLALIVGPWLASKFIFAGNEGTLSTLDQKQQAANAVILPYMLIAAAVLVIALLLFLTKMPEPSKGAKLKFDAAIFKKLHLRNAVLTQLFYVGAQAGVWGITINYVTTLLPGTSNEVASGTFMLTGTFLFVAGRFVGTVIMTFIKDHKLLALYGLLASALCSVGIFGEGTLAVYSVLGINFFMSIMFPTIFALGVKDLGEQTKLGASLIIMAIVGGALVPPVMGIISDHIGIQQAFAVPLVCFLIVAYFGLKGYKIKPQ
ncbi:MAG: L-fucose:H+ symporter permease [Bacteroidetes bacterium]|nr:L-fucose:H+ symporter permease [Bacteroidota bacterium]